MNEELQNLFTKIENSFYFMRHEARKAVNGNKSAGGSVKKGIKRAGCASQAMEGRVNRR